MNECSWIWISCQSQVIISLYNWNRDEKYWRMKLLILKSDSLWNIDFRVLNLNSRTKITQLLLLWLTWSWKITEVLDYTDKFLMHCWFEGAKFRFQINHFSWVYYFCRKVLLRRKFFFHNHKYLQVILKCKFSKKKKYRWSKDKTRQKWEHDMIELVDGY